MAVAKSPAVRLQISIKDTMNPEHEEVVQKVVKGYEVVNVDGFIFRRKMRKLEDASRLSLPVKGREELEEDTQIVVSLNQEHALPVLNGDEEPAAYQSPADQPDEEESTPQIFQEAEERAENGAKNSARELEECSNDHEILILTDDQSPAEDNFFPAEDLANNLLSKLPHNGSNSSRLLTLCQHLMQDVQDGNLLENQADEKWHEVSRVLQSALQTFQEAIGEALHDGTLICSEPARARPNAEDVKKLELAAKKEVLEKQLSSYCKEEEDWNIILKKAAKIPSAAADMTTADRSPADVPRDAITSILQEEATRSQALVTLQVDGFCAMLASAEELLSQANQLCKVMQAEYHKEKFMVFPHIDSPAKLIHEIVRPRHSRFMPASAF